MSASAGDDTRRAYDLTGADHDYPPREGPPAPGALPVAPANP